MTARIKLDSVELLEGAQNFESWKASIGNVLLTDGLWGYDEGEVNLFNPGHHLVNEPPAINFQSSQAEIDVYNAWSLNDEKAKMIITARIAPVPKSLLPKGNNVTARMVWRTLHNLYGRRDIISGINLRNHLSSLRVKDCYDYLNYLSEYATARARLADINLPFSEIEAVYFLMNGFPKTGIWPYFTMTQHQIMQAHLHQLATNSLNPPLANSLYTRITENLSVECLRQQAHDPSNSQVCS